MADKTPATAQAPSALNPKEWANPTAAGLVALAVACFCFFALLMGFVDKTAESTALPLMGCWLLGGFVVQLVVALLDLKGGNHAGGNTFLFFAAFFMLAGGLEMFFKAQGGMDTRIDGWAWAALTLVLWSWTPAFLKKFNLLSCVILALDVALPFISLIDMGVLTPTLAPIPAIALLVSGLFGVYLSGTIVVNNAYGKNKYPIIGK